MTLIADVVKVQNIARDPRVTVAISDPEIPSRYVQVRGPVRKVTTEGEVDHREKLAQKYLGARCPWYGCRDQVRVIIVIEPERMSSMG